MSGMNVAWMSSSDRDSQRVRHHRSADYGQRNIDASERSSRERVNALPPTAASCRNWR